jgi:dienelactone hydrolase
MDDDTDRLRLASLVRYPSDGVPTGPLLESREGPGDGFVMETLAWTSTIGERIPAVLLRPAGAGPYPAVLYCHAHGGRYDIGKRELIEGRSGLLGPLGPLLARTGVVVLCVEMPAFGERAEPGESSRAKERLWRGDTLFGAMLRDLGQGLHHLRHRPDVDPARIAAFGISMGAAHAFWMAALEPRIARVAHFCAYADVDTLIRSGSHDRHGHYMTVPGLLEHFSTGAICGLIAPRPQLIAIGARDPLTPPAAVTTALVETRKAYREAGSLDALAILEEPDVGHQETPIFRQALLDFLAQL